MRKDARTAIQARIEELGDELVAPDGSTGMQGLSRLLKKNPAYIQQFISGKQKTLPLDIKVRIARILRMSIEDLDVNAHDLQQLRLYRIEPGAFEEDAEPYDPPNSVLAANKSIGYVKMTSDVLSRHPLRITVGDVLAFDMSQQAVDNVRSEQIVLVQLYDKEDTLKARTVVREFIRPRMLITNREEANEAFSIDDARLPFEARIKGVFTGWLQRA
jgi:hypothetical protein